MTKVSLSLLDFTPDVYMADLMLRNNDFIVPLAQPYRYPPTVRISGGIPGRW